MEFDHEYGSGYNRFIDNDAKKYMSLTNDDKKYIKDTMTDSLITFWDQVLDKKFDDIENRMDDMTTKEDLKATVQGLATNKNLQDARDYIVKVSGDKASESIRRDRTLDDKGKGKVRLLGPKMTFRYCK